MWYGHAQGGAGWIMSRYAAEKVAPLGPDFMRFMSDNEDRTVGQFLQHIGFVARAMTSGNFMGNTLKSNEFNLVKTHNIEKLPTCLPIEIQRWFVCGKFMAPLNEVVFFHEYPSVPIATVRQDAEVVFNAPKEVSWWSANRGRPPLLCRQRNKSLIGVNTLWVQKKEKWGDFSWW
jgi:hypothetical protein